MKTNETNLDMYMSLAAVQLTATAQPRFSSNKETHNFGQIEWKHPVSVQYVITNTGDKPLVLTDVDRFCACSVAQWTQTPIAPGERGRSLSILMLRHWGILISP